MSDLMIPVSLGVRGRYKATKYDANLNIIEETAWNKNVMTNPGLDYLLSASARSTFFLHCVAGSGNNPAQQSDTTLQSYLGRYSACQAVTVERNYTVAPYFVRITTTHRFFPGAFGAGSVNVAEFGMIFNNANGGGTITAATPVHSRSLAVNSSGSPTAISVQNDEYLDVAWEWTWFVPESAAGSVNLDIDGVSTAHSYEARPACMAVTGGTAGDRWFNVQFQQGNETPATGYIQLDRIYPLILDGGTPQADTVVWGSNGALGAAAATIGGTYAENQRADTFVAATYTNGNYYRDYTASWGLNVGNVSGGMNCALLVLDAMQWKVSYSPAIAKVLNKKLTLTFRLSIANV